MYTMPGLLYAFPRLMFFSSFFAAGLVLKILDNDCFGGLGQNSELYVVVTILCFDLCKKVYLHLDF